MSPTIVRQLEPEEWQSLLNGLYDHCVCRWAAHQSPLYIPVWSFLPSLLPFPLSPCAGTWGRTDRPHIAGPLIFQTMSWFTGSSSNSNIFVSSIQVWGEDLIEKFCEFVRRVLVLREREREREFHPGSWDWSRQRVMFFHWLKTGVSYTRHWLTCSRGVAL